MAFAYQDLMVSVFPSQPNLGLCPQDTMPPTTFCGQVTAPPPPGLGLCPQDTLPPTTAFCPQITAPPPTTGLGLCPQDTMPTNGCPNPSAVLLEDTSVHGLTLLQLQLRLTLSQLAS